MSLEADNTYVEIPSSPIILQPYDQNCITPSKLLELTPSDKPASKHSPPGKEERVRGRARERLDFGQPVFKEGNDLHALRERGGGVSENKENFAVPKSPGPKQGKTPAPKTPAATVAVTPVHKDMTDGAYSQTRGASPVLKKHLQQLASLDDSSKILFAQVNATLVRLILYLLYVCSMFGM